MSYRIAGIDVHKKMLAVVVADVEAEGEDHLFGNTILLVVARWTPVGVGAEAFIEVAAVVVDEVVATVDDLFGDEEGGALGLRAVGFARIESVHAFAVDGIDVRDFLLEGGDVDEGDENNDAGDLGGVESVDEFFDCDDGSVFGAVGTGDEGDGFAGLGAVDDNDGDVGGGVNAGGDFEIAGGFLAEGGGGSADAERRLRVRSKGKEKCQKDERKSWTNRVHQIPPRGDRG